VAGPAADTARRESTVTSRYSDALLLPAVLYRTGDPFSVRRLSWISIDVLSQERVVTSGARDGSVRIWKIVEESQLVFHGHRCAILAAAIYMSYVDGMCSGQQASFADFVCILI